MPGPFSCESLVVCESIVEIEPIQVWRNQMTTRQKISKSSAKPTDKTKNPGDIASSVALGDDASEGSKWLNGVATTSAIASAVAAICALVVSCQERSTPYKTALFTARWEAIKEYAEASTALQQELSRLKESMPIQVGYAKGIASLTDAQIIDIAEEAHKIYPTWQRYLEISNGSAAFFSLDTSAVVEAARLEGRKAAMCYRLWGRRIAGGIDTTNLIKFRRKSASQAMSVCSEALKEKDKSDFDWAADKVLRAMTDELRENTDRFVPERPHNAFD